MIESTFISNILQLLIEGNDYEARLKSQLSFLTESSREYTGIGAFVNFDHVDGIIRFKTEQDDLILDGVKITARELNMDANASLFLKDGIISYLEIWCCFGEYPHMDLTQYTLQQVWENSPNRTITLG